MESLAIALLASQRAMMAESRSAVPDAPVVRPVERPPHARRTRSFAAVALRRIADGLAPAAVAQADPAPVGAVCQA